LKEHSQILINIELNLNIANPLMKLTVAHEVAHIGEYLLVGKMRHMKI
jgi:predicted SprT family Zn-dependent metalloprotease